MWKYYRFYIHTVNVKLHGLVPICTNIYWFYLNIPVYVIHKLFTPADGPPNSRGQKNQNNKAFQHIIVSVRVNLEMYQL